MTALTYLIHIPIPNITSLLFEVNSTLKVCSFLSFAIISGKCAFERMSPIGSLYVTTQHHCQTQLKIPSYELTTILKFTTGNEYIKTLLLPTKVRSKIYCILSQLEEYGEMRFSVLHSQNGCTNIQMYSYAYTYTQCM